MLGNGWETAGSSYLEELWNANVCRDTCWCLTNRIQGLHKTGIFEKQVTQPPTPVNNSTQIQEIKIQQRVITPNSKFIHEYINQPLSHT
ncbi:hypothetical protein QQF64_005949 [Cirrhinus molitorella]|uniref:Uncharacterized protein n=1 Tax=Cirrhinus molitorella TaxID=172907 RepID=A0ABR3MDQ7_9TELE